MSGILLTLVLMAPPDGYKPLVYEPLWAPGVSKLATNLSPDELRDVFRGAIRASYQGEPHDAVPGLVQAYQAISRDTKLQKNERKTLKARLRSRMIYTGGRIMARARTALRKRQRDEAKAKRLRENGSAATAAGGRPADYDPSKGKGAGASGGNAEDESAEALIELIRTTIAPESWNDAGGPGSIVYYKPLKVLVIRQTQEVHWLVGGFGNALRRAR